MASKYTRFRVTLFLNTTISVFEDIVSTATYSHPFPIQSIKKTGNRAIFSAAVATICCSKRKFLPIYPKSTLIRINLCLNSIPALGVKDKIAYSNSSVCDCGVCDKKMAYPWRQSLYRPGSRPQATGLNRGFLVGISVACWLVVGV
jgi:hypothetical protein